MLFNAQDTQILIFLAVCHGIRNDNAISDIPNNAYKYQNLKENGMVTLEECQVPPGAMLPAPPGNTCLIVTPTEKCTEFLKTGIDFSRYMLV